MVTYTIRKMLAEEVDWVFLMLGLTVLSIKSKYFQGRRARPVQQSISAANRLIFLSCGSRSFNHSLHCHCSSHLWCLTTWSPASFSQSTMFMQVVADIQSYFSPRKGGWMSLLLCLIAERWLAVIVPSYRWGRLLLPKPVGSCRLFWFWQNTSRKQSLPHTM